MTSIAQKFTKTANTSELALMPTNRRAPDSIMAELWAVKARMNAQAGYDVDQLLANVREIAKESKLASLIRT